MDFAFASYLLHAGRTDSAAAVLVSCASFLRAEETVGLLWNDVLLPGDMRLEPYEEARCGFVVQWPKTGRRAGQKQ